MGIVLAAVVVEQGVQGTVYYVLVGSGFILNALFLAAPFKCLKDLHGALVLFGMLLANALLLIWFAVPASFLVVTWMPAAVAVSTGYWIRPKRNRRAS